MTYNGLNKSVVKKIHKFETEKVSLSGLKRMLYDTYEPFYLWGKTEGKTEPSRTFERAQMYSVDGPGRKAMSGAEYWIPGRYVKDGYVILYDTTASPAGFRTFPIHRIDKIEKDGVVYTVAK
jgi:hypothetical protein